MKFLPARKGVFSPQEKKNVCLFWGTTGMESLNKKQTEVNSISWVFVLLNEKKKTLHIHLKKRTLTFPSAEIKLWVLNTE